jgi:hypothetical protein
MYPGAFQNIHLLVMDPYDVALTKLKRDSELCLTMDSAWARAAVFRETELWQAGLMQNLRPIEARMWRGNSDSTASFSYSASLTIDFRCSEVAQLVFFTTGTNLGLIKRHSFTDQVSEVTVRSSLVSPS